MLAASVVNNLAVNAIAPNPFVVLLPALFPAFYIQTLFIVSDEPSYLTHGYLQAIRGRIPIVHLAPRLPIRYERNVWPEPAMHVMHVSQVRQVFDNVQRMRFVFEKSRAILVILPNNRSIPFAECDAVFKRMRFNVRYIRLIFVTVLSGDMLEMYAHNYVGIGNRYRLKNTGALNQLIRYRIRNTILPNERINFQRQSFNAMLTVDRLSTFNVTVASAPADQPQQYSLAGRNVWLMEILAEQLNATVQFVVPAMYLTFPPNSPAALLELAAKMSQP